MKERPFQTHVSTGKELGPSPSLSPSPHSIFRELKSYSLSDLSDSGNIYDEVELDWALDLPTTELRTERFQSKTVLEKKLRLVMEENMRPELKLLKYSRLSAVFEENERLKEEVASLRKKMQKKETRRSMAGRGSEVIKVQKQSQTVDKYEDLVMQLREQLSLVDEEKRELELMFSRQSEGLNELAALQQKLAKNMKTMISYSKKSRASINWFSKKIQVGSYIYTTA